MTAAARRFCPRFTDSASLRRCAVKAVQEEAPHVKVSSGTGTHYGFGRSTRWRYRYLQVPVPLQEEAPHAKVSGGTDAQYLGQYTILA